MKFSLPVDGYEARELKHCAKVCGWVLARDHAALVTAVKAGRVEALIEDDL